MRFVIRSVADVPFTDPIVPFNIPLRRFPGPSKLAKLRMLYADTLGSTTSRSPILKGRERLKSKLFIQPRATLPGGGATIVGESAPSCTSCVLESRPAV